MSISRVLDQLILEQLSKNTGMCGVVGPKLYGCRSPLCILADMLSTKNNKLPWALFEVDKSPTVFKPVKAYLTAAATNCWSISQAIEILKRLDSEGTSNSSRMPVILLEGCERLPTEQFCELLKLTRRFREEVTAGKFHIVFGSNWNWSLIRNTWKDPQHASPPLDDQDIYSLPTLVRNDIIQILQTVGAVAQRPNAQDHLIAEIIAEETGGNDILLQHLVDHINRSNYSIEQVENWLLTVHEQQSIQNSLRERMSYLSERSQYLLRAARLHGCLTLSPHDIDANELWLWGFLGQPQYLSGGRRLHELSSPIIHKLLKVLAFEFLCENAEPGPKISEMVLGSMAPNVEGYRLAAKIENMLRNLVVTQLHHTPDAYTGNESLKRKGIQQQKDICGWMRGQESISFTGTTELSELLISSKYYNDIFHSIFPDHHHLESWLDEFLNIRHAIAHNRTLSVNAVRKLTEIHDKLRSCIGRYAVNQMDIKQQHSS